jgi:hypothetical protein
MNIVVVGAPGSGKTCLADALRLALQDGPTEATEYTITEGEEPSPQRGYDLTLLMGNDLLLQGGGEAALQSDARLRHTLNSQAIAYAVVYGRDQARLDCALQAIAYHRQASSSRARSRPATPAWHWNCETCSDAACEHRLFTALVSERRGSVRP